MEFSSRNGEDGGFTILETLGGGVALLDYDGDGDLDLFLAGGGYFEGRTIRGHPCRLYRNRGDATFEDVTRESGLDIEWWYNHGAAVADYDRDGFPDLIVTGYGRAAIFHNEAKPDGSRRFVDASRSLGFEDNSWSTSAAWGDIDGDGWPDLYVCHYCDWSFDNDPHCEGLAALASRDVCPPERFKPLVHALFKNEGGKRFRNVSAEHGFEAKGNGLGVVIADLNDDRHPDVYVANDATNKFLFFNRGGKLVENGLAAGAAVDGRGRYNGSMGVDLADCTGSGRPSLFVTNFQRELHALYRNDANERFQFDSEGIGLAELPLDLVGFGAAFLDADRDGWEDVVAVHGHVLQHPPFGGRFDQPALLLRNEERDGRRRFRNISSQAGPFFDRPMRGRGLAVGDLDNDGAPDFVVSHVNAPAAVLRNRIARRNGANWVGFRLVGRDRRDVVGSTMIVEAGGRRIVRFTKGGGSYLSASDPRILVGLGSASAIERVTVKWSWGGEQTWSDLAAGRYWTLSEGAAGASE
ncbi:MAG: CRTAC1 family protein [Gemmataceae bacterium]